MTERIVLQVQGMNCAAGVLEVELWPEADRVVRVVEAGFGVTGQELT